MVKFFKSKKLGNADSTCENENSADYIYHPKDTGKLRDFIEREGKPEEKPQGSEESSEKE